MEYTIILTEGCNMKCKYCYQGSEKNTKYMDKKTLEKSVDFIFENCKEDKVSISLFGGEPLLKKDLIYECVDYINKNYSEKEVSYSITTNCTLMDDKIIQFFKENNFSLRVSIDGNEETHNLNRIGESEACAYEKILENIYKVKKAGVKFSIRMTITKNNFQNILMNVKYFHNFGFKNICLGIDYFSELTNEEIIHFKEKLKELKNFYLDVMHSGDELMLDIFDGNFLNTLIDEQRGLAICAGGIENFKINPSGDLYPCSFSLNNSKLSVGNIYLGADKKKTYKIINDTHKRGYKKCDECNISFFCQGMKCGYLNQKATGYINVPPKSLCETEKVLFELNVEILEHLYNMKHPKIQAFLNYIKTENINMSARTSKFINALGESYEV